MTTTDATSLKVLFIWSHTFTHFTGGNKEDSSKRVQVECQLSTDRFWAKVCDEGEGYDPCQVPDCCDEENLEAPGGRGLALIRAYMTTVEHSPCGRCLTMEKIVGN